MDHSSKEQRPVDAPEQVDKAPQDDARPETTGAELDQVEDGLPEIPSELPVLPVRNVVVFPGTVVPLSIGREKSKRLIDAVLGGNKLLAVFTQRREDVDDPGIDDIYRVGTAAQVLKLLQMPDGTSSLLVHGLTRVGLVDFVATEPYWRAIVEPHHDEVRSSLEVEALTYNTRRIAERVIELSPNVPDEALQILRSLDKPGALADFLAANLSLGIVQKQELLETFDIPDRLRKVSATLQNQLEVLQLAEKIQADVRKEVDKTQREYYLHEQLKAIQKELGEEDPRAAELAELRERLAKTKMPDEVRKEAERELTRLERISPASPEGGVIRDYLEWLMAMPWETRTEDNLDLDNAEKILNADHYGLDKIKRRLIEYLAVRKLNPNGRSPILCFAGPPGVGKTSLGQSIARALGRKFIRIALGGVRDEADIRGHRRTYIGAIPGRLIQEIRKAGSKNPVIMLDELDKIGSDFRGDPASALLEVLDPEQNHSFTDHYLDVPFDLSDVLFIGTANYMDPVEPALRDRMEVLELPGYTTAEKLEIAKRYLVPRQLERNGIADRGIRFQETTLRQIIEGYTRESGVRNLERSIGTVCRGIAAKIARGKKVRKTVTSDDLAEYLGPVRLEIQRALPEAIPGVVTGLAYTPVGGEIIFVEATIMPGRGSLQITGQVGEVMRESALAALSLLRTRASRWKVPTDQLPKSDIHIHVPAGAIPKDGPSAGVAMLAALYTRLTNQPADPRIGMTGEITLRGAILPIGGVKEKVLGAHRAGLNTVILPAHNQPDIEEVPPSVRNEIAFVFVEDVDELLLAAIPALQHAKSFGRASKARTSRRSTTRTTTRKKAATSRKKATTKRKTAKSSQEKRTTASRTVKKRRKATNTRRKRTKRKKRTR